MLSLGSLLLAFNLLGAMMLGRVGLERKKRARYASYLGARGVLEAPLWCFGRAKASLN